MNNYVRRVRYKFLSIFLIIIALYSCKNNTVSHFNHETLSIIPELSAPSIVKTDRIELNVVFNYGITEMFFSRIVDNSFVIQHSELINGR